jgi:hypothetical protein
LPPSPLLPLSLSSKDLLYEVQEQALVRQGEREERIMRGSVEDLQEPRGAPPLVQRREAMTTMLRQQRAAEQRARGKGEGKSKNPARRGPPQDLREIVETIRRDRSGASTAAAPVSDETGGRKKEELRELLAPYAGALRREGVVRIDSVLDGGAAARLREWAVRYRAESARLVREGRVRTQDRFADVLLKKNRSDMTLPLLDGDADSAVAAALAQVLCRSPVGVLLESAFAGEGDGSDAGGAAAHAEKADPVLYELSTLISDPGSQRQVVHPDNPMVGGGAGAGAGAGGLLAHGDDGAAASSSTATSTPPSPPVLLTCFVALQDVTEDMGPTLYLPGTHTAEAHARFFDAAPSAGAAAAGFGGSDGDDSSQMVPASPKEELLSSRPKVRALLRAGDCALYDSRVLHCGTANRRQEMEEGADNAESSPSSRALFYFSFRNPAIGDPGNPPSVRPDVGRAQLRLSELREALAQARAQSQSPREAKAAGFGGGGSGNKGRRNSSRGQSGGFGTGAPSRRGGGANGKA